MEQQAKFEGDVWLWHNGQRWLWKPQSEPQPEGARAAKRYSHDGEAFIAWGTGSYGGYVRDAVRAD